jgi:CBS domain containing-hemolysin-like protein
MTTLVIAISIAVCISFICSLAEAALFAVGPAYVHLLNESGSRMGKILARFKGKMDKPIAAILITNTIANIMMAAIAGGVAQRLWGNQGTVYLSIVLTFMILFFGEIIPKVLGVTYSRKATVFYIYPLNFLVTVLKPFIWFSQVISRVFRSRSKIAQAPEEEILALAKISAEEGSILPIEKQIIMHALMLDDLPAKDIMTPRTVLKLCDANRTVEELQDEATQWTHSRIPVYEGDIHNIVGVVLRRDVVTALAQEEGLHRKIKDLAKPIHFVPEMMSCDKLLTEFLKQKMHLFCVIDEYGEVLGVVSLEDVLESLIGTEIMDEKDIVADLQELARKKWNQRSKVKLKHPVGEEEKKER